MACEVLAPTATHLNPARQIWADIKVCEMLPVMLLQALTNARTFSRLHVKEKKIALGLPGTHVPAAAAEQLPQSGDEGNREVTSSGCTPRNKQSWHFIQLTLLLPFFLMIVQCVFTCTATRYGDTEEAEANGKNTLRGHDLAMPPNPTAKRREKRSTAKPMSKTNERQNPTRKVPKRKQKEK